MNTELSARIEQGEIQQGEHTPVISIIVPVYNDANNVALMVSELDRVFRDMCAQDSLFCNHEIIFVNDGSRDNSWEEIEKVCAQFAHVHGICFSRNFGHMYAMMAGFDAAKGDAVVTMDSDLEDPPALLPDMIRLWKEGYQVVRTKRTYQLKRPWFKRKSGDWFYWTFNKLANVSLENGVSEFRLLDRQAVDELRRFREQDLFHRGIIEWIGFRATTIPYEKGERINGTTSYNLSRMFSLAWMGISSFSTTPLWLVVAAGVFITSFAGALLTIMALMRWIFAAVLFSDIAFLVVFIIFSNGLILSAVGVLAMYLSKIHREVLGRPHYIVWKKANFK